MSKDFILSCDRHPASPSAPALALGLYLTPPKQRKKHRPVPSHIVHRLPLMYISQSIRYSCARATCTVSSPAIFPSTLLSHRTVIYNNRTFQTFPGGLVGGIARKRGTLKTPAVLFRTSSRFFESSHVLQPDKHSGSGATPKRK